MSMFDHLSPVVLQAGRLILAIRHRSSEGLERLGIETKQDGSPVTRADQGANDLILKALEARYPDVAVVSEEALERAPNPLPRQYFLIDPLDGTRAFIRGGDEFTVNIGLICDQVPVFGMVYAPALGICYATLSDKQVIRARVRARKSNNPVLENPTPVVVRPVPAQGLTAVASRGPMLQRTRDYLDRLGVAQCVHRGSSLKLCLLAAGCADIYPRLSATMAWDTAAGDAILRAAGGTMTTLEGDPFVYGLDRVAGAEPYLNPWFLARGGAPPGDNG